MVSRPPRVRRLGTLKPQGYKFEFINEGIDGTHRIVFGDPVIQSLREEHRLVSTLAFDESLHGVFPRKPRRSSYPSIALRFHTTSTLSGQSIISMPDVAGRVGRCLGPLRRLCRVKFLDRSTRTLRPVEYHRWDEHTCPTLGCADSGHT